jgi:hypothetical protein
LRKPHLLKSTSGLVLRAIQRHATGVGQIAEVAAAMSRKVLSLSAGLEVFISVLDLSLRVQIGLCQNAILSMRECYRDESNGRYFLLGTTASGVISIALINEKLTTGVKSSSILP